MVSNDSGLGGGCGRKATRAALTTVLHDVPELRASEFSSAAGDAAIIPLPEGPAPVATSVDLLYDLGSSAYDLGYVAVIHALSDIYAVLAQPWWALTIAGAPRRDFDSGEVAEMMKGVVAALEVCGTVPAGGHSVYSDVRFCGVSVAGIDARRVSEPIQVGDVVLLSKPIGTGIALAALKQDLCDVSAVGAVFDEMKVPNRSAAEQLRRRTEDDPGSVRSVTDVSGFGLLDAIASLGSARFRIHYAEVPTHEISIELMLLGASSPLGDQNMLWLDGRVEYSTRGEAADRVLLNDPQTSGGLLAVVAESSASHLCEAGFTPIGTVISAAEHSEIEVV